jgi:putative peptide zinc metalloprotease protein
MLPDGSLPGSQPQADQPRLRLRRPLNVSLRTSAGQPFYLIEDPTRQQYFRLGVAEWEFVSRLDGTMSMSEALQSVYHESNCDEEPSMQFADGLCRWLITNQLVDPQSLPPEMRSSMAPPPEPPVNPFFIKIPLLHPEKLVEWLLPKTRFLLTFPAFVCWTILLIMGGYSVAADWSRFANSASSYMSPVTWIWLWVVWLSLKVLHEAFHGLVCKKYGGSLGAAGCLLILFSPVAFVDVTSSWRFRSRWQRIFTSAAGMYVEFAIAAVAAIVWANTQSGMVNFVAHSVVTTASVMTLLFNANPLMRFDGYYILADLFDFQNLSSVSRQYINGRVKQVFLGTPAPVCQETGWRLRVIEVYGVLSSIWKILISLSMVLGAAVLFEGAGIALAAFGAFCWFAMPIYKFGRYIVMGIGNQPAPPRKRFAAAALSLILVVILLIFAPWPGGVSAPAIVTYANKLTVRSATDGFVKEVLVESGQVVKAGDILVRLENEQLTLESKQVQFDLRASSIEARRLNQSGELAAYQAELENLSALKDKARALRDRVESLTIVAEGEGQVLSLRLHDLNGRFVEAGATLLEIGKESEKEIEIAIAEEFVDAFTRKVGDRPRVSVAGKFVKARFCELTKVEPTASLRLRHPALGGNNGGPLAVQHVSNSEDPNASLQLVSPRMHGTVGLDRESSLKLRAGQLGVVRFWDINEMVGHRLYRNAVTWIRGKLQIS